MENFVQNLFVNFKFVILSLPDDYLYFDSSKNMEDSVQRNLLLSSEATVTLTVVFKWGILKSPVSHVLNFLGWIKLIFDTADLCNFVINELNPT